MTMNGTWAELAVRKGLQQQSCALFLYKEKRKEVDPRNNMITETTIKPYDAPIGYSSMHVYPSGSSY